MGCYSGVYSVLSAMAALRELPYSWFRMPRYHDLTFEEAMDRTNDPLILHRERRGFPMRDMVTGRVNVSRFYQSSQLEVLINLIQTFMNGRENWTWGKEKYMEMEKNFAMDLFNVLCCVKRNIDWSVGGKPPIDRDAYELLMECYDFEPFQKYWSRRKRMRAIGYKNTIKFYYETKCVIRF